MNWEWGEDLKKKKGMEQTQVSAQDRTEVVNTGGKVDKIIFSSAQDMLTTKEYLGRDVQQSVEYSTLMLRKEACPEDT